MIPSPKKATRMLGIKIGAGGVRQVSRIGSWRSALSQITVIQFQVSPNLLKGIMPMSQISTQMSPPPQPLVALTDDENLFRDNIRQFADQALRPKVREM